MNENIYSSIVIGAGIAGLYTCYRIILKSDKDEKILLLESTDRVGGRLMQDTMGDVNIPLGGGIIRYPKDKHLINLIENELHLKLKIIPWKQYPSFTPTLDFDDILVREMPRFLEENKELSNWPFFMFVREFFGNKESKIREFYDLWGFTDMLFISTEHVFSSYGVEDVLYKNNKFYAVIENGHWDALTSALMARLESSRRVDFNLQEKVVDIRLQEKKVVTVRKGCGGVREYFFENKCFQTIGGILKTDSLVSTPWPFLRIYIRTNRDLDHEKYKKSLTTRTNLQRVIFFTPRVVMASYADGQNALYWRDVNTNPEKRNELLSYFDLEEKDVVEIKVKFWPVGVHFFTRKQLKRANYRQHDEKNIIRVGEWVSLNNQGWVEGEIETVDENFKE